MGVLQGSAQGREAHVITERVAQHRPHQVTCSDKYEGSVSSKDSGVGELEHCSEKDPRHSALSESQQFDHMMKVSFGSD